MWVRSGDFQICHSLWRMRTLLVSEPVRLGNMMVGDDEAYHGRIVLRLKVGDIIRCADGVGSVGVAAITEVERHHLRIVVTEVQELPHLPTEQLTVALAPPKGDRFGDVVRMLTELGVGTILPLITERGEHIPPLDRVQRIANEALKQCQRAYAPKIGPVVDYSTLEALPGQRIVLDQQGSPAQPGPASPTVLIIGPEGGFTYDELAGMKAGGAQAIRLAAPTLRIETAAVAAAAVWTAAWELP